MGISSSLNAGVNGLNVNAQRLAGISDNIANSQTYGYKRAETDFSSLVNYGNSLSSYNAGGVRASTTRNVTQQGSLVATGNSTDISINGRGMIPVTSVQERGEASNTRPFMLTTTGSFTKDDEGFLRTDGGLQMLGWPVGDDGTVGAVSRESAADLQPVNLNGFDFVPNPTTHAEISVNLPSAAAAGDDHSMTIEYFDALGSNPSVQGDDDSINSAAGTWTAKVYDSSVAAGSVPAALVGDFVLDFDTTNVAPGSLEGVDDTAGVGAYDPATGAITVAGASGPIDIVIGELGTTSNLTQFSADFAPVDISKNGSALGYLESFELNDEGFLEGIYDTGQRRSLYQIPIANVANPEGLTSQDNQAFRISNSSGPFYLWNSGDGPTGSLTGYTLQGSTTDITQELTQLIETQRAYSSNAKIVQTVDEMLQETTNLKR